MDNSEHTSLEVGYLADSIRRDCTNIFPLSKGCCIYTVPEPRRRLNPSDYTPQMVSIGPIHRGKEELRPMEEQKLRYVQHFLQRTQVSVEDFLLFIKLKEVKLRSCYAESIELSSESFLRMILVDAVFLIEFFLRNYKENLIADDDRILGKPMLVTEMLSDFWLLENQLPLFILQDLFQLAKSAMYTDHYEGLSLIKITRTFFECRRAFVLIQVDLIEKNFPEANHFLDLLCLCLNPSPSWWYSWNKDLKEAPKIPTATELRLAGVKFRRSNGNQLDITFNEGILKIPLLQLNDETERFYRNILVFESMHHDTYYFSSYVIIMHYLLNSEKDVELLIKNGIVGLGFGNSGRLSTTFSNLVKDSYLSNKFQYSDLVECLNAYCSSPWPKCKVTLKKNFAYISVFVANLILVLTIIQTVCSIMAV